MKKKEEEEPNILLFGDNNESILADLFRGLKTLTNFLELLRTTKIVSLTLDTKIDIALLNKSLLQSLFCTSCINVIN